MRIIFVCTSNVCRSPAAAGLASKWLKDNGRDWEVISRSISTEFEPEGSPASEYSVEILRDDFGIDISSHVSKLLTQEDINEADFIVGITSSHRHHILYMFPEARSKCLTMPVDIPDPWHQSYKVYHKCMNLMSEQMGPLFAQIDQRIHK